MAEMKKKVASRKRKELKKIDKGQVHIQSTFNNTIVTVTDMNGNAISQSSAGALGYKGNVTFTYVGVDGETKSYGVSFNTLDGEALVTLAGLNVYDLCSDITITVTLNDSETAIEGKYNLATYADGLGENNAFAVALYNYAKLAKEYKANESVIPV